MRPSNTLDRRTVFIAALAVVGTSACGGGASPTRAHSSSGLASATNTATTAGPTPTPATTAAPAGFKTLDDTLAQFGGGRPNYWSLAAPGVVQRFSTDTSAGRNAVCLTFDACGGSATRYDARLIDTLRQHQVPATLFINQVWAMKNPATVTSLLADPLFQVENHGSAHKPLSVSGRSAYGIAGTKNLSEAWHEISDCHTWMASNHSHLTRFMRPGTAYSDDVCASAAAWMGQPLVGFSVNSDAGASFPAPAVHTELLRTRPGDIVIGHFNHPGSGTAPGYAAALPTLLAQGIRFRRLDDVL